MTTCLTNDQLNDKERWQFWAKKRFLKVGSYLRKISKAEVWTHVLRSRLNIRTFGVCLHQKSRDTVREIWSPKGELPRYLTLKKKTTTTTLFIIIGLFHFCWYVFRGFWAKAFKSQHYRYWHVRIMSRKEIQLGEGRSRSILGNRMFSRGNGGREEVSRHN